MSFKVAASVIVGAGVLIAVAMVVLAPCDFITCASLEAGRSMTTRLGVAAVGGLGALVSGAIVWIALKSIERLTKHH